MVNPQWLELPIALSRSNFHGPKDVRAIEVRLYVAVLRGLDTLRSILAIFYEETFFSTSCLLFCIPVTETGVYDYRGNRNQIPS